MATFFGDNLANTFNGGAAADQLFGAGGNDTLNGGGGNDTINGDSGNDSLISGAGVDFVYGGEGNDTLEALAGGLDDLFGGIGDDVYIVNTTGDNLVEGPNQGTDLVRSSVTYILDANVENLALTGVGAVSGTGNALNNLITGNSANNNLSGLGGNDTVRGLGGNDTLTGGAGTDILTGGAGTNQFVFETALPAAGVDTITDFSIPLADKIVLDKTVFSTLETLAGNPLLAADFSVINVPAASEVAIAGNSLNEIVYNSQTGSLFYNANNNVAGFGLGGGQFAKVQGSLAGFSNTAFRVVA